MNRIPRFFAAALVAAATFAAAASAAPTAFTVESGRKFNTVRFHSEATIESFDGETHAVEGRLSVDPADLSGASAGFTVDLKTLDTGLSMRNKHMRENHLHTDRFPTTSYEMSRLAAGSPTTLVPGAPTTLETVGAYDLHGVTLERPMAVEATWFDSGEGTPVQSKTPVLHVVCRFDVALADHEIPRPEFLFMKVAETIQVEVDLWAVSK